MNTDQIVAQSRAAYGQWAKQWREQAQTHSHFKMKSLLNLESSGIGRAILCVANGYSFEENIETIKAHQHNVDIICCDKTLGHLIDHGITPKYVLICDANVNYELYMEPWKNKLQDTIALVNVCANPKWAASGNWKDIYFFVNKDVLGSEKEFSELSGCRNFIPAGTNVSNAMVVMLTQSDNNGRRNFFGYDKILLIGYDYSWRYGGKYYAFDDDGGGKHQYMRHAYCATVGGDFAYTSGNLAFSAQWFESYVKAFNLPVVQCTKQSILAGIKTGDLAEHMQYRFRPEDSDSVRSAAKELRVLNTRMNELKNQLASIGRAHWDSFLCSV